MPDPIEVDLDDRDDVRVFLYPPSGEYDHYEVVRVPVVGPTPFTTLVCVRGHIGPGGVQGMRPGRTYRFRHTLSTPFVHAGRGGVLDEPLSRHATSVTLQSLDGRGPFTQAIDEVDAGFDWVWGSWVWRVTILGAVNLGEPGASACAMYVSSWVLCEEPSRPAHRPGATEFRRSEQHLPPT